MFEFFLIVGLALVFVALILINNKLDELADAMGRLHHLMKMTRQEAAYYVDEMRRRESAGIGTPELE